MDEHIYFRVEALRPVIRREWEALLRKEPSTPMGHPDALVFLMNSTLDQWTKALGRGAPPAWARHRVPDIVSLQRGCTCGKNPLLCYFATGELAVRAAAAPSLGAATEGILQLFRALARHEIETLCSLCREHGSPCPRKDAAAK